MAAHRRRGETTQAWPLLHASHPAPCGRRRLAGNTRKTVFQHLDTKRYHCITYRALLSSNPPILFSSTVNACVVFCAYPTQSIFALFRRFGLSGCSPATDAVIQRFSARAAANASFLVRWICVFVPGEPMDAEGRRKCRQYGVQPPQVVSRLRKVLTDCLA